MTRLLSAVTATALSAGVAIAVASPANAAPTTPSTAITNDPNASNGTLAFYDTTGKVQTHGSDLSHLFDYALASSAGRSGATKATLYFAFPDHAKTDSESWYKSQKSGSTPYPNTAAPDPLNASTNPLVSLKATDGNLAGLLQTTDLDDSDGYAGIVQVRAYDAGVGVPQQSAPFWASDIYFDQTANTWQQVFPAVAAPTATTTTVTADPASPSTAGTNVTFTATVSPTAAAGTVQFKDGTTNLGSAAAVNGGKATVSTSTLTVGTHDISATFTPTDASAYATSTSATISYTVNPAAATQTTTTLSITPSSPAPAGTQETLTATVTPAAATGTVQFEDGTTNIGAAVAVTNGTASTTATLDSGAHTLTAVFTPTSTTDYTTSTSPSVSYTVNESAKPTTTTIGATPSSPQQVGTDIVFNATVTPSTATGTVQFKDAGTNLGAAVAVNNGSALSDKTTLSKGTHQITAVFVPQDATVFNTSTSQPLSYVIASFPGTPKDATATAGNQTATVSWTAPADDGGSPIVGYDVQYSTNGVDFKPAASSGSRAKTATSAVVTELTNGTPYYFRVAAINAIGTGAFSSATTTAVTPVADATVIGVAATRAVVVGRTTTVSGVLSDSRSHARVAGVRLTLQRRPAGQASFTTLTSAVTNSAGGVALKVAVGVNTQFRWTFPGNTAYLASTSAIATTAVAPVVSVAASPTTVKHGKSTRLFGTIAPSVAGLRVTVQQLVKGRWASVGTATVKRQKLPNGKTAIGYVLSRKIAKKGTYSFRAVLAASAYSLAGTSRSVTVRAS